jgi:hypothetical protein
MAAHGIPDRPPSLRLVPARPDSDDLPAAVRRHCAEVARSARSVRIATTSIVYAEGRSGLDPDVHLLDAADEVRARYVLVMDAINFGSGWFATLDRSGDEDVTTDMSRRLTEHARRRGAVWSGPELRALTREEIGAVLGQDPAHELMGLYARALGDLGAWLGDRAALDAVAAAGGSARRLARQLAEGMPFFDDPGFYKRAQITPNDLAHAGVAAFDDLDELTVFADNLLPHVLRLDGVLDLDDDLAARIDAGEPIAAGSREERELRGCAVHACELLAQRAGVAPRVLDNWLWNRGTQPPYSERPAHRTPTVLY